MLPSKPKLPEEEGSFFVAVKESLAICEDILQNFSKEKAQHYLSDCAALWKEVHFMLTGQVLKDFNLEDTCLLLYHDKVMELNTKVMYDGLPLE
jgi:hypothetical protein